MKRYKIVTQEVGSLDIPDIEVRSSEDAYNIAKHLYKDDLNVYESFFVIGLSMANKMKDYIRISHGGVAGTVVDPILVAKFAIDTLSKAIVLVHNHPSGNLKASVADRELTKKIIEGMKLFEITVLDHIIVTDTGYLSFADEGLL